MMRTAILIAVAVAAAGCAKQANAPNASQPVAINTGTSAQTPVHVQDVKVSPQTMHAGQPATILLRLDSADPNTMIRVSWFGPDGWSVFESKQPASSTQVTFTAPAKIFSDPGRYRAEVRTGNVYQGDATVDVTG